MLTLVIQAGGESRRMGQDKGLVPFLGVPLIRRVLERLRPIADEVFITTNQPDRYEFLGIPLVSDAEPGRGALGGLYTALLNARGSFVAVVACDMPFANPDLLQAQFEFLQTSDYDAVIPKTEGGTEPFHAVYRRETCLPAIETALLNDRWRVNSWFDQVRIHFQSSGEINPFDPQGLTFMNVNTPEELQKAEEIARSKD